MKPAAFLVLLLAVAAGAALIWFIQQDRHGEDDAFQFPDDGLVERPAEAMETTSPPPTVQPPSADGLPRILPPDAAVEDVRDALALKDAKERETALGEIYASIGRIAQQGRILAALQRYATDVEDDAVRGVTWAAVGANQTGTARAWLAGRLSQGPTLNDRVGATLGLAYEADATPVRARSLGGLPHKRRALPERVDIRDALPSLLMALREAADGEDALLDVVPVLEATLTASGAFYDKHRAAIEALRKQLER